MPWLSCRGQCTGWLPIFRKPDTLRTGYAVGGKRRLRPYRISRSSARSIPKRCPPEAPMEPTPDFNPKTATKKLLREGRSGALATLMPGSGDPYCSLVNVATAADGAPLLLISRLAIHTKNVLADHRVSLMIDERKEGDPLQGGRIMIMGTAAVTDDPNARRRYLERQPEAQGFAAFADFSFYQMALKAAHLVAGFGRIVDLKPTDVLTATDDAGELVAAEPDVLAHMNEDHAEACRLYATKLLGAPDG